MQINSILTILSPRKGESFDIANCESRMPSRKICRSKIKLLIEINFKRVVTSRKKFFYGCSVATVSGLARIATVAK